MLFILLFLSFSVSLLLLAEKQSLTSHSSTAVKYLSPLCKIIASCLFIAFFYYFGYQFTQPDNHFAKIILLALILSLLGDALLIPKSRSHYFLAGIIAFGLAHIAYAYAFLMLPFSSVVILTSGVISGILALYTYFWLKPHLHQKYQMMVPAYLFIIAIMVTTGVSAGVFNQQYWFAAGTIIFALSDIFVARNRFVNPGFINRLIGLPLYYAAQIMIGYGAINLLIEK